MNRLTLQLRNYISQKPKWFFIVFASLTAFLTYSCMYAFRKPFTIAAFEGYTLFGADYKIWLITAQVLGYTLSKFIGIKFVSEMVASRRAVSIVVLVCISELALLLVYLVPYPYNFVFMFFNGLPLGIIWGLVFSYLEGREFTELLGAVLSISFIIASGFVKSVGKFLMMFFHTSEFAMPFLTGAIFLIPLIICVFLLNSIPPPSARDIALRTKREPMNSSQRKAFLREFLLGIILMVLAYMVLTIFREIRENFANEIWNTLGFSKNSAIFTVAEIPVAFFTLLVLSLLIFIKSNIKGLMVIHGLIILGFTLILFSSVLFKIGMLNGYIWMIMVGTGLYLGYIPFNAFLFERMISAFKYTSNIGFVMYVSDACGYCASLGVVFFKNFNSPTISWINFFVQMGIWNSVVGIILISFSMIYFAQKYHFQVHNNIIKNENKQHDVARKPLFAFNTGTTVNK